MVTAAKMKSFEYAQIRYLEPFSGVRLPVVIVEFR